MRPISIPVTGTTDSSGAATLRIPLERTGDWRNVKLALGTTGPAEWAILKAGVPITFGRGRRVTLGPELLEPQDTITVTVTGGPVSAAILGSVNGLAGTQDEILATYVPAPNTIALDQSSIQQVIGTVTAPGGGGAVTGTFQVPSGVQVVGFIIDFSVSGNPTSIKINGHQTGNTYIPSPSATVLAGSAGPYTAIIASTLDTSIDVIVTPGVATAVVDVLAFFTPINTLVQQIPGTTFSVTEKGSSWIGLADSGELGTGVQATATLAGVVGHQWICRQIDGQLGTNAAPVASALRLRLRDGASGVGAILRSWTLSLPAVAGQSVSIVVPGLAIKGTTGNAMTLEWSVGVANIFESCGFGADQL
jgi:hypothetical protein